MNPITPAELAAYFDHTQLRAYAQRSDFEKLCAEAREYGFAMVAINPAPVSLCKDLLAGTSVHVGAAVGFPLGQSTPKVKKYETVDAIANGADEIDYVINITQLKEKNYDFIEHEMAGIVEECRGAGVISKVIFENCYLTDDEKKALCGLNLHLDPGDFVTVIGGNGAGKSTMLNATAGTFFVDSGKVIIDGSDVTNLPEHKRAAFIGRVFQDPMMGTAPSMWIEENLALAARRGQRRGLSWGVTKEEKEQYRELLGGLGLGLESRLTTKVSTLSGGQRQALTLLMATLKRPKLLLLDEHTAALDPKTAAKVMELTDRIVREGQLTTLMITHNMRDAIQYGNRLIMLHDGHVILDIAGEEKKKLTVPDLLEQFTKASGDEFANDRAILS